MDEMQPYIGLFLYFIMILPSTKKYNFFTLKIIKEENINMNKR